jgi:glycosyltransferase involved in cell wall biosynthesis
VIPTRGRPGELRRSLASALAQRDVSLEAIAVDDASPEPYARATVAELGDERARALTLPVRRGPAGARNAGVAAARGKWVAFLDDDDEWAEGKIRAQIEALEAGQADWAWCATSVVLNDGTELWLDPSPPTQEIHELLRRQNCIPGSSSSVIARAAVIRALGGFDEQFAHLADWDLWIRLAAGWPAASSDEVLVTHRIHDGGMHQRDTAGALAEFTAFRAKHPEAQGRAFMRWVAGAHWRSGRRGRAIRDYTLGRLRYR